MLRFLWNSTRGYRLRPWASPYLRWRIETYWGLDADAITASAFLGFMWTHRGDLLRFLRWTAALNRG
jgi:hypothetical protein